MTQEDEVKLQELIERTKEYDVILKHVLESGYNDKEAEVFFKSWMTLVPVSNNKSGCKRL